MALTTKSAAGESTIGARLNQRPNYFLAIADFTRKKPMGAFGAVIFLTLVFMAIFAPWVSPYDPLEQFQGMAYLPPSLAHPFGTDYVGRDMLSRIIWGSRISLMVGIVSVLMATTTGALLGLTSGYWGGRFDLITQRFVDALQAFPGLVLNLAIVASLGRSIEVVMLAIGVGGIGGGTRTIRAGVMSIVHNQYIDAARAIGARDSRIILLYVLPNVAPIILILATVRMGGAILAESSLSFLGFGAQPPDPAWGLMLSGAGRAHMLSSPWLAFFPGLAISLVVMGFNLLGDALRDVWDPRLRGGR